MKFILLATSLLLAVSSHPANANAIDEPKLNACNHRSEISRCEVKCVRNLGEQCLITHINFEGKKLKPGEEIWRAKFQTCRNADIDLQIKSLVLELNNIDEGTGPGAIMASVSASGHIQNTRQGRTTVFEQGKSEGRLSRIPFDDFLNSGENFVEASLKIKHCGAADNSNSCNISGKLVAVTNPNIRCEFQDTTQSGAFRPPKALTNPSLQNSQKAVGRIGE